MTKIFAQVKSKTDNQHYSTYIEIDEKGEVIDYGCTCKFGSFYMFTKTNMSQEKLCWHINFLKEKYERARKSKKTVKPDTETDSISVCTAGN